MKLLAFAVALLWTAGAVALCAQEKIVWSGREKPIVETMRTLRGLAGDVRTARQRVFDAGAACAI